MKRVLVRGALGQLGLSIQDIATEYIDLEFVFTSSEILDITDAEKVNRVITSGNFDWCINCAAYTNVEQAERIPEIAFKVNADGVKNLALACKQNLVSLVHISTDYVFDGKRDAPYTPEDIPNPINEYGKSKWEGEKKVQQILKQYFIVRTSWLYHKKHGKNFYKTILEKANKGQIIQVTNQQIGSPTNAENLAKYIINLICKDSKNYGIHHYTDQGAMTWFSFAKQILKENNLEKKVKLEKVGNYRTFAQRPKNSVLA